MTASANMTVQLGDLVVVAFDWAEQHSADPREIPFLATKATWYLLQHSWKTSPSRPTPVLLPLGDFRKLPEFETAGRRPGLPASTIG